MPSDTPDHGGPDPSESKSGLNATITQGVVDVLNDPMRLKELAPAFTNWLPQIVDLNMLQHGYRHRNSGPDPIPFPIGPATLWAHGDIPTIVASTATSSWSQIQHGWGNVTIASVASITSGANGQTGDAWSYAPAASGSGYTIYLRNAGQVHVSVRARWAGPNFFSNPTLPFVTGLKVTCDAEVPNSLITGGTQTLAGPSPGNDWQTLAFVADYGDSSVVPASINVYTGVQSASAIAPSELVLDIGRLDIPRDQYTGELVFS